MQRQGQSLVFEQQAGMTGYRGRESLADGIELG